MKRRFTIGFLLVICLLVASAVQAGFVTVQGDNFYLDGNRWFPYGVNYFPSFYQERPPVGQDRNWFQDIYYNIPGNREQLDRELDKIRDLGYNFILIQGIKETRYCSNFNDFLDKARARGLKVSIYMQNSDPLANFMIGPQTYQRDLDIIRQCNIANNDVVLGYELDWEPSVELRWTDQTNLPYNAKRRNLPQMQDLWNDWITKNYGSSEHAFQNWRFTPERMTQDQSDAVCVSHTVPARSLVGTPYMLTFTVQNTGRTTWTSPEYVLSFLGAPLQLPHSVAPGQQATFTFPYTIPQTAGGPIDVYWQMTRNNRPFGDICRASTYFVTENPTYPVTETFFPQIQRVPTPTDDQVCNEGSWKKYANAYYRFMNDLVGDSYRQVVDAYKSEDPNHIIYAHIGSPAYYWSPGCRMLEYNKRWSVAKYLDAIPEEIYDEVRSLNNEGIAAVVQKDGFRALYDYVGKPIILVESGLSNECDPTYTGICNEANQQAFFQALYDLMLNNPFKGIAAWWFTGRQLNDYVTNTIGSPVYDNYGIVENNTLREYAVASTIRDRANSMKSDRAWAPNTDLVVDPDAFTSFQMFYRDGAERYVALVNQGLRPRVLTTCTDKNSANVDISCVGNAENDGRCPVKCLHSRFLSFKIKDGQGRWIELIGNNNARINVTADTELVARAAVENLQETTWLTGSSLGSVSFAVKEGDEIIERIPIEHAVNRFDNYESDSFVFSSGISEATTLEFTLEALQRTTFGDTVSATLVPETSIMPTNRTNRSVPPPPPPQIPQPPQPPSTTGKQKGDIKLPPQSTQIPVERKEPLKKIENKTKEFSQAQQRILFFLVTAILALLVLLVVVIFLVKKHKSKPTA